MATWGHFALGLKKLIEKKKKKKKKKLSTGLLGVFGAVASLHLFRAGGLEVVSDEYRVGCWVRSWIQPVPSWLAG